jgi:hypothetical protein
MPSSSKWLLSFSFHHQNTMYFCSLPYVPHAPPVSHLPNFVTQLIFGGIQIMVILLLQAVSNKLALAMTAAWSDPQCLHLSTGPSSAL